VTGIVETAAVDSPSGAPRTRSREKKLPQVNENPKTARGRQTKDALVRAAQEVFARDGFVNARIADIAVEAGTAHGSFYTYFESKDAIFREAISAVIGEIFAASSVREVDPDDAVGRIAEANKRFLAAYGRNWRLMAVLEQAAASNESFKELHKNLRHVYVDRAAHGLEHLQQIGMADETLDVYTAAHALGGMVEQFARVWFIFGEPFDQDLALATLTRLWCNAIGIKIEDQPPASREAV
jgi:AcrR family transcriptional regulator